MNKRVFRITSLHWAIFSLIILTVSAAWIWASAAEPGDTTSGSIPAPRQGFLAPDFRLPNDKGDLVSLADFRGQPVLVNIWASWCPPCRAEMPAMQRVYEDYRDQGFTILAINTLYQDDQANANEFISELGLTFTILWDSDGVFSNQYQLRAMPTSFFIGADGNIKEVVVGGPLSEALMRVRVEELIQESN